MECDPTPGRLQASDRDGAGEGRRLELLLDTFAWEMLAEQSTELGVSVEELVSFSVLYYIADLDSKRIARKIFPPRRSRAD
jgi:hypothetical protein